jgi:cytochrome c-type biogenesis protein
VGSIGEIVLDGNFALALPIALLAGLVSFASPCVLPLVPGYLGYIGGFAGEGDKRDRRRLLLGVSLFILGFSLVFIATGVLFGTAGLLLRSWLDIITPIAGVVIIIMGLVFVGQFTFLQRQFKPQWKVATGLAGAPLLGIVFAIGWTPCLGPVLIAVNAIVFDNGDPWRGGLLALAYCIGLGVPFLLVALGVSWFAGSVTWLKRHVRVINVIGGSVLVLIGVLMVSGLWRTLISSFGAVINGFVPAL